MATMRRAQLTRTGHPFLLLKNKMKRQLDTETIRTTFWYDATTGLLLRRKASNTTLPWARASFSRPDRKRRIVKIGGTAAFEHNVAWVYAFGPVPEGFFVDHVNRDESDNRLSNLRLATLSENCKNRVYPKAANKTPGVYRHGNGWVARLDGTYLGYFKSEEEAARARTERASRFHVTAK